MGKILVISGTYADIGIIDIDLADMQTVAINNAPPVMSFLPEEPLSSETYTISLFGALADMTDLCYRIIRIPGMLDSYDQDHHWRDLSCAFADYHKRHGRMHMDRKYALLKSSRRP